MERDQSDCPLRLDTEALPKAPADLSDAIQRFEYIRDMSSTLRSNSQSIGETLQSVASRTDNFDYVRRTMGTGKRDPEQKTMLEVHDELMQLTESMRIDGGFSAGEVLTHADGAGRKVVRLLLKVPGAHMVIPNSLEARFEVYSHKKVDYKDVVHVVQTMIDGMRGRMDGSYDELISLERIVREAEIKAQEYGVQLQEVQSTIKADPNLTPQDRENLESAIVKPLADAQMRLVQQAAMYRTQIQQRYVFLQGAGPVIENTAGTASVVIPAMQVAQNIHEDATALRQLAKVKPQLEGLVKRMFDTTATTLEKTAQETRNAHLVGELTPEYFAGLSDRMLQVAKNQHDRKERLLPDLMKTIDAFNAYNDRQRDRERIMNDTMPALVGPRE